MKKTIATATAVAAAVGGVGVGAVLTAGPVASAQEGDGTDQNNESFVQEAIERARQSIRQALAGLVEENVITEEQADTVADTLAEELPMRRGRGGHAHGFGFGFGPGSELLELLDLEASDLAEALAGGSTLAEIAEAQGVDADAVADLLVSQAEMRLEGAVDQGFIDEAEADEKLADIEAMIDDFLNGELPIPFDGPGKRGGRGAGGFGDKAPEETTTS